jgi:hypothetical protein
VSGAFAAGQEGVYSYFGETVIVGAKNQQALPVLIERFNKQGGTIILDPSVKKGPLPARPNHNTRIVDMRYPGGINMVRGNHPRLEGIWPQYSNLNTGLGRNLTITDVLPYDAQVETWKSEPMRANPANKNRAQDSHEYSNSHNHYQNLLSEVWAFSPTVNAVSIWGDSGAFYPGTKSWGGFLSARSWPVHWQEYVPSGTPGFEDKDFDAQLVGLEVDVLNGGLDHGTMSKTVGMPLSKSGIQIVGFGKRNTAAIEIRSEDSDDTAKKADERRGTWHYGIIAYNSLNADSTFLFSATPAGRTGADFSMTDYSDSALKIKSNGPKTGISFNKYQGGEIYAEADRLVARMGKAGLSVVNSEGDEVLRLDNAGVMRWAGIKLAYVPYYAIPIFMLVVLFAMVAVAYKMSREIRDMRARLARFEAPTTN